MGYFFLSVDSHFIVNFVVVFSLFIRFELSYDEILNALPLIDMSRTIFWPHCPGHVKPINCRMERFRSYTGHCNNLENPSWGAANTAFVRYLPPVYSNGNDDYLEKNANFLPSLFPRYRWLS